MNDALLVLNAGSSSLKFSVHHANTLERLYRGQIEGLNNHAHFVATDCQGRIQKEARWPGPLAHDAALEHLRNWLGTAAGINTLNAVGHRVVHGGAKHSKACILNEKVLGELQALEPLAPLHQAHNLAPIRLLSSISPGLVQVACFDTAFHRTQSRVAQAYALPRSLTEEGVQRYGFHGLSYEYIASVLPAHDAVAATGKAIVLHLGAGASACALLAGKSVATSMGFTALDGLPMATRCGNLDPGVLLYLMQQKGMSANQIEHLLYHESGLLGMSGFSGDMRDLIESEDIAAHYAIEVYVYRISREIGSLAAALGGIDALVFTAGVGEHAQTIRAAVCRACSWLGVELDEDANQRDGLRCISKSTSRVRTWVIPTDEEMMIARHTQALMST